MTRLSIPFVVMLALGCGPQKDVSDAPGGGDAAPIVEETKPGTAVPLDPDVRTGTLPNGLTYFIRKHQKPEERAMLWLAVDAGSVLEDDDQKGLAHFVEHMAFNGTERFEKNTLIDFIERAGMDFGADLNAFTSFDETVYMLTVPTDDPKMITMGMDILEDWSGALSFDPKEVDKERGVVIEEWRLGRGAGQRTFDKQQPIYLEGSKYANRKPIGDKEILETAPVDALERYYKDWYRPDNMAVVVVGDIDPDAMQKEIEGRFSDLENPANPRERINVPVPILDKTRAAIVTDDEQSFASVSLAIKGPRTPLLTEENFRTEGVQQLFHGMLRARLQELGRKPDAPFVFAFTFTAEMGRAVDVFRLWAGAKPGRTNDVLKLLTTEVERVRRHGFLESEFEREKLRVLRQLERDVLEQDKVNSRGYAFELVNHFLEDDALPSRELRQKLAEKFLPTITLDEINAVANEWTSRKDRVILASGATRDKMPSEQELLATVDTASKADVKAYVDEVANATLMARAPKAGTIEREETVENIGVTVWTLSNGAKVVVKPTDFKNDEIRLSAFSPGGTSLAPTKEWRTATSASGIVSMGGMGDFDRTQVQKMMAGKVAYVGPWINELEEGVRGSASPRDLETLMQMVHLTFTAPRKDPEAFEAWKSQQRAWVKNRDLNPQAWFSEKLVEFATQNHPRRRWLTDEAIDKVDLDGAFDFYKDRFADAGDFTFVFVGNADLPALKELSATYLASLPTNGRKEKWKDVGIKWLKGTKKFEHNRGQDPKSQVSIEFHGKAKWSKKAAQDIDALGEVLNIRLREVLREEMGGVYGAFSYGGIRRRPKQRLSYSIGFGCAPENVDKLKRAVFDEIASLKKNGIGEDYIGRVKELARRALETDRKQNNWWISELTERYRHETDPSKIIEEHEQAIERVSSKNVQAAAKKYLKNRRLEAVLWPESGRPKPDDKQNTDKDAKPHK